MKINKSIIASRTGYQGERLHVYKVKEGYIYMSVDGESDWYEAKYTIVDDGVYNQSVKDILLPYVVVGKDVYSLESFKDWKGENV